jgi:hypothetical protein
MFGYYQNPRDVKIWKFFVPYTLLFFGTVYLYAEISAKVGFESDKLELPEEPHENELRINDSIAVFGMAYTK